MSASNRKYKSFPKSRDSPSRQQSRFVQRQTSSLNSSNYRISSSMSNSDFYIQGGKQASFGQAPEQNQAAMTDDREHLIHRGYRWRGNGKKKRSTAFSSISGTTSISGITRWQRRETETVKINRRSKGRQVRRIQRPSSRKIFPRKLWLTISICSMSQSIINDLERAIEYIVPPAITNVMTHNRVIMKERMWNKFGPNSQKDAEKTRRKLEGLHGDNRGWDIYLTALDTLVKVLSS